jgi:hypothetical protein
VISLPSKSIFFVIFFWDYDLCLVIGNIIHAYEATRRLVFALEVDQVSFCKALLPLVKESKPNNIKLSSYSFNLDSPSKKKTKKMIRL